MANLAYLSTYTYLSLSPAYCSFSKKTFCLLSQSGYSRESKKAKVKDDDVKQ